MENIVKEFDISKRSFIIVLIFFIFKRLFLNKNNKERGEDIWKGIFF